MKLNLSWLMDIWLSTPNGHSYRTLYLKTPFRNCRWLPRWIRYPRLLKWRCGQCKRLEKWLQSCFVYPEW